MSDKIIVNGGSGISFCSLLTILFIGLKLTGVIAWSWWGGLSPIWIPFAIILGFWLVALVTLVTAFGIAWLMDRK